MKIALPISSNKLCMHFGHCDVFTFFTIDPSTKSVTAQENLTPPPHEPGVLPRWIKEQGATVVLAGGMGKRAQDIFSQHGVTVITGVQELDPLSAVKAYLAGSLQTGANCCDH